METERTPETRLQALSRILLVIGFFLLGQVMGWFTASAIVNVAFGLGAGGLQALKTGNLINPQFFWILMLELAIASGVGFIGSSLLYLRSVEHRPLSSLSPRPQLQLIPVLLTVVLVLSAWVFSNFLFQLTRQINFQSWGGIGRWIVNAEESAKTLTDTLTDFKTFPAFLTGFAVIAVLPAVGEEMMFRGLMQPQAFKLTRNIHAAIWITAAIFSFIHFQFYGFLSRMMLGVVFGYLYTWSGNILYPMLAHLVHNGIQAVALYLYQQKIITLNLDDDTQVPAGMALASLLILIVLMLTFRKTVLQTPLKSV